MKNQESRIMKHFLYPILLPVFLTVALAGCMSVSDQPVRQQAANEHPNYGLLVMAHGAGERWNSAVLDSVSRFDGGFPVEVAFGMADAGSMERAVRRLEERGVEHVGVVRLFISGESFLQRTEQILGLKTGAPSKTEWVADSSKRRESVMPMGFWKIDTGLTFHLGREGLADAEEMDAVLLSRLAALSSHPAREVAMVLAHGPGDDDENQRWVSKISERTQLARDELGLQDIRVFTLREDWALKREQAEQAIRNYAREADAAGYDVLVVPFRVMGFGPYEKVLEGIDYRADQTGLLPHANVSSWIHNQARQLKKQHGAIPPLP